MPTCPDARRRARTQLSGVQRPNRTHGCDDSVIGSARGDLPSESEQQSALEINPVIPATDLTTTGSETTANCRFCGSGLRRTLVDLGMSPLCESFLREDQLRQMEPFYP